MAEGKKSFIAYSDWKDIFDELPNEDAGMLIKHIFAYVNDENPKTESVLIKAVFANIKSSLKRDLRKWEKQIEQRSKAGKASAEAKKIKANEIQRNSTSVDSRSTKFNEIQRNSTVSVNDSVSVNDILLKKESKYILPEKLKKFDFKKSLIEIGISKDVATDWILVRKNKKATNSQIAFTAIKTEIEKSGITPDDCIRIAVEKSWSGFKASWLKPEIVIFDKKQKDEEFRELTAKLREQFPSI